jgi:hypothetical protein
MSALDPTPQPLHYSNARRTMVVSATAVVIASLVPGLGSLLLRGRRALGWSLSLIVVLAFAPVMARMTVFVIPYPHRTLRMWSQEVIFWGIMAAVLVLSVRRGLRDHAEIQASADTPAYRRGWSGIWPIAVVLLVIGVIALLFLGLVFVALSGLSHAK